MLVIWPRLASDSECNAREGESRHFLSLMKFIFFFYFECPFYARSASSPSSYSYLVVTEYYSVNSNWVDNIKLICAWYVTSHLEHPSACGERSIVPCLDARHQPHFEFHSQVFTCEMRSGNLNIVAVLLWRQRYERLTGRSSAGGRAPWSHLSNTANNFRAHITSSQIASKRLKCPQIASWML